MPVYNGKGASSPPSMNTEKFTNMDMDLSSKLNIVIVLLALLLVMTGYCCFKK